MAGFGNAVAPRNDPRRMIWAELSE